MPGEWFTPADLAAAKLPDLPDERAIRMRADREGWRDPAREGTHWRKRAGRGGGYEYHRAALPRAAQVKLAIDASAAPADDGRATATRAEAWAWFDGLADKKKQTARDRLAALDAIEALVVCGTEMVIACLHVAKHHQVGLSTLYRWREMVAGLDRCDWLPALAPRHAGRLAEVECTCEAWEALKADYLRLEKPNFTDCYRRLEGMAAERGWTIPSSSTLFRRVEAIPEPVRAYLRDGAEALKRLFPAQQRLRGHFHALEAVNADGHLWDVFVRWPDGSIGRPMMCAFQDLYSGLILSWRVDRSANKELTRLAFGDVVEHFGIPSLCYFDNGRDFTSKLLTGGTPNRYRFKVMDEEPLGILPQLGVEVHFATPYSGQSKPIERAFRDFAGGIAKHPRFAGAYVGRNTVSKPENYGAAAVPLDVFLATVAEGIAEHNARLGRESRVCGGKLSFAQAFAASYATAPIKKATAEQRRLWLLAAEQIRVDARDGSITLEGNRFWSEALLAYRGQRVTVRFDPQALQAPLHVYRIDGGYLAAVECVQPAGFNDAAAATDHGRKLKAFQRATRDLAKAKVSLSVREVADMLAQAPEPPPLPETKVVRPLIRGANALKPIPTPAVDNLEWLQEANAARRAVRRLTLVDGEND